MLGPMADGRFKFKCPTETCRQNFTATADMEGTSFTCPTCQRTFTISVAKKEKRAVRASHPSGLPPRVKRVRLPGMEGLPFPAPEPSSRFRQRTRAWVGWLAGMGIGLVAALVLMNLTGEEGGGWVASSLATVQGWVQPPAGRALPAAGGNQKIAGGTMPAGKPPGAGAGGEAVAAKVPLPGDFALLPLTLAASAMDLTREGHRGERLVVAYLAEDRAVVASNRDVAVGLAAGGLQVKQSLVYTGLISAGVIAYGTDGWVVALNELRLGSSIEPLDKTSRDGPVVGWKPESFACIRENNILGVWDTECRMLREIHPEERAAVVATLLEVKSKCGKGILEFSGQE